MVRENVKKRPCAEMWMGCRRGEVAQKYTKIPLALHGNVTEQVREETRKASRMLPQASW